MPFIDKTYFVGDLDIARTNQANVVARLDWFIEKYEAELLEKLLGAELYAAFMDGVSQDPVADRWNDLLFGATYFEGRYRWKGFLQFSGGITASLKSAGDKTVVVGRGEQYDPLPDTDTTEIPAGFVGRPFDFVQRGFGEWTKDEYSIAGNVLTLLGGVKFSGGDTFFYKAPYSVTVEETASTFKQSLIANYVYYWWHRDQASLTTGIGQSQPEAENAESVSPILKMVRAWNEMAAQIRELVRFLDYNRDTYPEWRSYTGYCVLQHFKPTNRMGI